MMDVISKTFLRRNGPVLRMMAPSQPFVTLSAGFVQFSRMRTCRMSSMRSFKPLPVANPFLRCSRRSHSSSPEPRQPEPRHQKIVLIFLLTGVAVIAFDIYYYKHLYEPPHATLTPTAFKPFKLMEAIPVTHDTTLFRFAANLPDVETPSGIIVPSHVVVKDDSCQIAREYTPITYSKTHFDLLVKKYENGSVSKLIHSLEPGDKLEMRGPIETLPYEPNVVEEIGMIAGGTGISPLYQLIKRILRDPSDKTRISLIYANRSEDDIPLHNELQLLSSKHPDRLRVYHTIEKQRHQERPWGQGTGYVSAKMIKEHLPASERGSSAAILVCGPDGMIQYVAGAKEENNSQGPLGGLLAKLGYQERQVFKF